MMLGGALALLSAALFGLSVASVRRGILTGSILQGLSITVPVGVPVFLVMALATGQIGTLWAYSLEAVLLLCAGGVVHFLWGRYCNYRAIRAMGANLVGPVQPLALVIALALAVALLGEVITPLRVLGIALVLLGPTVALRARKTAGARAGAAAAGGAEAPVFRPRYLEGYAFALLSATGYGMSPIFVRAALDGLGAGAGLTAGLISYAAATVAIALVLLLPGRLGHARAIPPGAVRWFAYSGGFVSLSQMARYVALAIAPVTVVTPLVQTATVFRTLFGWVINREHEVFGVWVISGILVSLIGAVALTVSTDMAVAILPLPEGMAEIARWRWSLR